MQLLHSNQRLSMLQSFILFALSVLVIVQRYPSYITSPRIWAEESIYLETFFSSSDLLDGFNALIYPAYYLLIPRISGLLASLVQPENAALITTICGTLVLLIPIIIIVFGNSRYWSTLGQKLILTSFLIFSCSTGEIWMNSTNVGFIMAIVTFLILIDEDIKNQYKNFFYGILLSLAILTGPISLLMSPFFLYRFIKNKEYVFLIYCFLFLLFGLFQISYFFISLSLETTVGNLNRGIFISNSWLDSFFYWVSPNIIFPLFGYFFATGFRTIMIAGNQKSDQLDFLYEIIPLNTDTSLAIVSFAVLIVAITLISLLIAIFIYFFKRTNSDEKAYLMILFLYLSFVLTILSLGGHGGYRYSYVTSFILLFFLLQRMLFSIPKFEKNFLKIIISLSIFIGFIEYYPRVISFSPDFRSADEQKWPNWKNEVTIWKENADYNPKIWPNLREKTNIWPARSTVWKIDLNNPKTWDEAGNFKYTNELKKYIEKNYEK